jgi:6-phosphofructo-2-kinase/fructose-2,6-biphosphatase 2
VLVVCHLAVLRCIYAYFMDVSLEDLPFQDFDRHALYELTPGPFGCACTRLL